MSTPTRTIEYWQKTWFDRLSIDQLKDLCRAADIVYGDRNKGEILALLYDKGVSTSIGYDNVESLKDKCRSRSLPVSGLKYQLVLRVLAYDTLKKESNRNYSNLCIVEIRRQLEKIIKTDSNACYWLAEKMEEIRYETKQGRGLDARPLCPHYQSPLAAIRDAEYIVSVLIQCFRPNAGTEYHDSLWTAIKHLGFLVVEARVFMDKSEKKAAVNCIRELDNFLSEFMLDDNPKKAFDELVKLLKNDAYYLSKSALDPKKKNDITPARKPLRCLMNDEMKGSNKLKAATTGVDKKKQEAKVVANKNEFLYEKLINNFYDKAMRDEFYYSAMTDVLRNHGVDSNYVYERLVGFLSAIKTGYNSYEALGFFRSAFMGLIVHFEDMNHPEIDSEHNFSIAIELLGDVLEEVLHLISTKEKSETIRWMTDLRTFTRPHCLGEIAEMPLSDLISMVKDSLPKEVKRRFY